MTSIYNDDKIIQQLLKKLDQGSETIMNLRSLLSFKTLELNELLSQLQLIDQVLANVEKGTEEIESIITNVIDCKIEKTKLLEAETTLDSLIQSAYQLYTIDHSTATTLTNTTTVHTNKRFRKTKSKEKDGLLKKISKILDELNISSSFDLYKNEDIKTLQKSYNNLHNAKSIGNLIKNKIKYRNSLLLKKNYYQQASIIDKIAQLGVDIRNQVSLFKTYTKDSDYMIHDQDIITILNNEDLDISRKQQLNVHNTMSTKKSQKSSLQSISRPTSSSLAKVKDKKALSGPGSTLRLRNLLSKRNPQTFKNHHLVAPCLC